MSDSHLRTETEQNQLLLEIYSLSRRFAVELIRKQEVDDVVHEIAEGCLVKLRENEWYHDPDDLELFVRVLVWNHLIDRRRKRRTRRKYDAEHLEGRNHRPPAWTSADRFGDEDSIAALQNDILPKLPYRARVTYILVRREGWTYAEVAGEFGVSRETVHNYISEAHRVFRKELEQRGIITKRSRRGGGQRKDKWRRIDAQLYPSYPASVPVASVLRGSHAQY